MNDENNIIVSMLIGAVIFAVALSFACFIKNNVKEKIEDAKTEHLTITYKNSKCSIADKEMLVNIMKQYFPTSSWYHVDTKADESHVELDAWNISK